jgi:hypothetical protein
VLEIQESGTLATRVEILGWQTQDVRVGGLSPPAGRLLDELAARPASDLNELLSRIEIPVQLCPTSRCRASTEDEVTIPAVDIPLARGCRRCAWAAAAVGAHRRRGAGAPRERALVLRGLLLLGGCNAPGSRRRSPPSWTRCVPKCAPSATRPALAHVRPTTRCCPRPVRHR